MKHQHLGAILAALAVAGVLLAAGCENDDDSPTDPEPLPAAEVAAAAEATDAASAMWLVSATALASRQSLLAAPGAAGFCPQAQVSRPDSSHWVVSLDFGTSCDSPGGYAASGKLLLTYATGVQPETVEIGFEDFAIEGMALDGTLTASGSGSVWTFVYAGTATGSSGTAQVAGTFALALDTAGTPGTAADDVISVSGTGVVSVNSVPYALTIDEDLLFSSECAMPFAGQLTYRAQTSPPRPATTIDFSPGDCCTVEVTIGVLSEEVDLCSIE